MGAGKAGRKNFLKRMKKKILIYNWIPFDETEGKGGGVTVYTKNLIKYLAEHTDWEIFFLSSGRAYDRKCKRTYIEQTTNIFGKNCRSYQIVNSPVLSSAHLSFAYPEDMLEDRVLKKVVGEFFAVWGGFDIVHFQNFEGLSLSVLELKEKYQKTRFIYSLHNYYMFCPQVMLWRNDRESCTLRRCGRACISCMPRDVHKRKVIYNQQINYELAGAGRVSPLRKELQNVLEGTCKAYDKYQSGKMWTGVKKRLARNFQIFRERNVWHLNQYMDVILAVSGRVAEIAVNYGVDAGKVAVSYIGTEAAANQKGYGYYPYNGAVFYLCYLGYMRKMKGFYFLLDALEHMPAELAGKIGVKLAAPATDKEAEKRIKNLKKKFAQVIHYPGYTHEELPEILEHVQLGIVPSLWEDNLPQVAIEMKAQGIPVLTSSLGGAKELTRSEKFIFKAGDREAFIERVGFFVRNPDRLEEYWRQAPRLVSMQEHVEELKTFYMGK